MAHGDKITVEFGPESMRVLKGIARSLDRIPRTLQADTQPAQQYDGFGAPISNPEPVETNGPKKSYYHNSEGEYPVGNWDEDHTFTGAAVATNVCVCGRPREHAAHALAEVPVGG